MTRPDYTEFDAELVRLTHAFSLAKDAARAFVVSNEFGQIVENNGGRIATTFPTAADSGHAWTWPVKSPSPVRPIILDGRMTWEATSGTRAGAS